MPENLTRRLLQAHLLGGRLEPGADLRLAVDQVLVEDATGTMTAMQFEMLGCDRVQVPLAVMYVDHNVLQIDDKNMQDHRYLQTFARRYGLLYSRPGKGISHYLHLERFARPGELLLGADSHTTMAGAVGMFAAGAGGLDVALAMAGHGFELSCPRVVGIELTGRLPDWVEAKDVILEILRRYGVRGGSGAVFEFFGEGVRTLSVTERGTIANMIAETGATSAVFPSDERVREWLRAQQREAAFRPLAADPGADYDELSRIDLSALEPLIAVPQSPGNVVPVREVAGTRAVQVCVGSSVNSSYDDLATVASVLRGAVVHPDLQMTVTPGSRQILQTILESGVYRDLTGAGARMLEPICGPCVGIGQAPVAGEPSVRTFNRNFPGRSGTAEDAVYLCSPGTAAATALRGVITDPRDLGEPPSVGEPPVVPNVVDAQILPPGHPDEAAGIEVVRGPNLVAPPEPSALPDRIASRVAIVLGDDVSTGDMTPDGAIAMSVWSNITECARYLFRRIDPEFVDRTRGWGGGLILAGHNYGQGSSREHAALAPLALGIPAIVAKSYARIHRSNLIAQGVAPLLFDDEDGYAQARVGDEWTVDGLRSAVESGEERIVASTASGGVALRLTLTRREREVLLAGGRLRLARAG